MSTFLSQEKMLEILWEKKNILYVLDKPTLSPKQ